MDRPIRKSRRWKWTRPVATVLIAALLIGSAPSGRLSAQGFVADGDVLKLQLETMVVSMMISAKIPPLVPITVGFWMAWMMYTQAALWSILIPYDTAIVRAWTTENILALDYQLRGTISMIPDYVQKLKEDKVLLEKRLVDMDREADRQIFLKNLTGADAAVVRDGVAIERGFLDAVNQKLEWLKTALPPLNAKCEALIGVPGTPNEGALGKMRREWLVGPPTRELTPDERKAFAGWNGAIKVMNRSAMTAQNGLAVAFSEYANAASQFYDSLIEPVSVKVTTSRGVQDRSYRATASGHRRAIVTNDSSSLVYFVKVIPGDPLPDAPAAAAAPEPPPCGHEPGDLYRPREIRGRRGWVAIFPKDAKLRMNPKDMLLLGQPPVPASPNPAGPVGATSEQAAALNSIDVQFPSSIWFPVEPGDKIALRVATYGETRKQIRWMDLKGATLRPELESVRRTFYYMGYEVAYGLLKPKLNLLYALAENYSWSGYSGAWEELKPVPVAKTSLADLYEQPWWVTTAAKEPSQVARNKHSLEVRGDQIIWAVPTTREQLETLDAKSAMKVKVSGRAQFVHQVNAESLTSKPDDQVFESGDGELSLEVQPW